MDRCPFREGVTLEKPPGTRPGADQSTGSFVDVGLKKEVLIDKPLKPGVRVTVRMEGGYDTQGRKFLLGRAVPPETPRQELGSCWGYELRLADGLQTVFAGKPTSWETSFHVHVVCFVCVLPFSAYSAC